MRLLSEARRREASTSRRVIVPLDVAPLVAAPTQAQVLSLGGETMGTTWSVKFVLPSHVTAGSIKADIEAILDGVIAQMSPWVEDSDISRYNCAPANSWRMIPDDFCAVLKCALKVAQLSDGAYDPAIGALVDLWGFGPTSRPGRIPLQEEIAATRESCGWRSVRLDDMSRALQPGGVRLDLSSIAKGFAVDKVSAWLCARGVIHHLVDIGGELMGQGLKPDGCPWWVALESFRPDSREGRSGVPEAVVALHGLAVATSGDTVRFLEHDGARLSHTIDPRTGWPVAHSLTSATVFHRSCMQADALATALFVLGPNQGMAFAVRHNVAARFVLRMDTEYDERVTPSLFAMTA